MAGATSEMTPPRGGAGMIPIALDMVRKAGGDCDFYVQRPSDATPILYCRRGQPIVAEHLEQLSRRGISTLYITRGDEADYRRSVNDLVCRGGGLPPTERYHLLREVNKAVFDAAIRSPKPDRVVEFASEFGAMLAGIVCDPDLLASDLFSLMQHDDGTYSHCVNVCTYCVLLAEKLGICESTQLGNIAVGGLLHDIGKRKIDLTVLNKRGRLDDNERRQIREHPTIGFKELVLRSDLSWGELMMVYQHHERIDGQGYPVGIEGRGIHENAKLCAVADVFHALTSMRPYRDPLPLDEALSYLKQQAGTSVDKEMVICWISTMATS